jgi:hypothetical protein
MAENTIYIPPVRAMRASLFYGISNGRQKDLHRNVRVSYNPDAHSIAEIDNIRWRISTARKGGLTTAMTWNALPLDKVNGWLKGKRKK